MAKNQFASVPVLKLNSGLRLFLFLRITGFHAIQTAEAQVINVESPSGGFEIDGNLQANTSTNVSRDWVTRSSGSGGFVLDNAGNPLTNIIQYRQ